MRIARVAACTVAIALLTTTTYLGTASADTAKAVSYTSSTQTGVVNLVLTLPSTIPALPGVPNPLTLTLLGTDATNVHGVAGSSDVGQSRSFLAGGSLVDDSALSTTLGSLNRILTSNLASPGLKTADVISVPSNPLGLGLTVADQKAALDAVTRVATSSSTLTSAQLGSLRSLGVGAVLDPVLAALKSALATVTTSTATLTSALSAVPALPVVTIPNPLAPILGGPTSISTPALSGSTLSTTVGELPAQVQALLDKLLDGAVIKLNGVDTSQGITPLASSVASLAKSKLASVELFGGLVTVTATQATAAATAGLTSSSASTGASATLLDVKVADAFGTLLQLVASDKGITAGLLDGSLGQVLNSTTQPIVATVDAALNTVLTELTTLLSSLNSGASLITQGTTTKSVSADGRHAEAHAIPASVTLGLPVAPDLITLAIGKADAVSAMSAVNPTVVPVTTPAELPHTGGSQTAGLLALGLLVVAGGAIALRRRSHQ